MPIMAVSIRTAWRRYQSLPGPAWELMTLGLALAVGLFILPLVIWLAGKVFLGDYVRDPAGLPTGGPLSLWIDYLRGLGTFSLGYWCALLGPYLLVQALRGSRWLLKM